MVRWIIYRISMFVAIAVLSKTSSMAKSLIKNYLHASQKPSNLKRWTDLMFWSFVAGLIDIFSKTLEHHWVQKTGKQL